MLNISSLQQYNFPSCLVTATAFCPDLEPSVKLPIESSCNCIKPDIFPFPKKLLQPDNLASHLNNQMKSVKVCSLPKLVPALLQEFSWIVSRNCSSDLNQVLDISALLGDKVTAPLKDKRFFIVKCHSTLLELWAGNRRNFPATQGRGVATCLAPLQGSRHSPCPKDGQNHLCLTPTGVLQKKGSMELQQSLVPHRHQPAPQAEPPGTRSMVKQREELCQAAG